MSLVDVSVSTETQLNVRSITERNRGRSSPGAMRASVRKTAMSVAMSGSIIPTPLPNPTTVAPPKLADATFITVSVVMIARAQASTSATVNDSGASR